MASNGTPLSDGRSGAGLGASPGGALGSSQGDGPAGRAAGPGVDQGVSPADQGIDSGVLTSGSTVSPATHALSRQVMWFLFPVRGLFDLCRVEDSHVTAAAAALLAPAAPLPVLHSLHFWRCRPCWQMLLPPHSLEWLRCFPCVQMPPPPHSLQRLRCRPCLQMPPPPQSWLLTNCSLRVVRWKCPPEARSGKCN